ncbi:MAG: UDP-3-O-(3-hydroxymyristoyl)glucosamine N-acyltransferase [Acidobacteriota bacterium]
MTLAELATRIGCRVDGDGTLDVRRVASLDDAEEGDVTFLHNPRYAPRVAATRASAIIADERLSGAPCTILRTSNPYLAFAEAVVVLTPPSPPPVGISPLAFVAASATVAPDVSIAPFACIGEHACIGARVVIESHAVVGANVTVGDDTVIRAHVSVRPGVVLGARVHVQDGAVIGSDGFGFAHRPDGSHQKIPQVGRVVIEDDVEIGALCAIDRPAVGETRIGAGTKVDNLVQIAHGVRIGRDVLMAAQAGVAGSTTIGDGVIMAGQSGATGHIELGAGAKLGAKSVATKDVPPGEHVAGIPAVPVDEWRESVALVRRLPALRRVLTDLASRLAALEQRLK